MCRSTELTLVHIHLYANTYSGHLDKSLEAVWRITPIWISSTIQLLCRKQNKQTKTNQSLQSGKEYPDHKNTKIQKRRITKERMPLEVTVRNCT